MGDVVIIGAGTMGGVIAAQLANSGWHVDLLDANVALAAAGLARVVGNKPPLLFVPDFAARIAVGSTAENLNRLQNADWVIEAVSENAALKRTILEMVEANIRPGTLVSSNTSGLSLRDMTANLSPEFRAYFLGTHFLNPPRYLKLLEVVPLAETLPEVVIQFQAFAEQVLGQRVVLAKDTPGFISTRLWISHLMDTIHTALEIGLTVEEVDALTGSLLGRPNSATFRMADLVGLDIIVNIARNQFESLPNDPLRSRLVLPDVMEHLIATGKIGQKAEAGFYARDGKNILAFDFATREYRPRQTVEISELKTLLKLPLAERLTVLLEGGAKPYQQFLSRILNTLCDYTENIGAEIAPDALTIDRVMEWGFHWQMGPCALQDCRAADTAETRNYFGTIPNRTYRVFGREEMIPMPHEPEWIRLADLKAAGKTIADSEVATLIDLGDGAACLEFHTKMNTFNPDLVRFLNESLVRAEHDFAALVLGSQAANFSAGYNLTRFLDAIAARDWPRIDAELHEIQHTFLRLKYAKIPVVGAPYGYTLGAGCEVSLHCARLQAAPELMMGLPELNVGVIPAGGGTKEMLLRSMENWDGVSDAFPRIESAFRKLTKPQNSTSAEHARQIGFLRPVDLISRNADRQIYDAKQAALALVNAGYTPPARASVQVLGADALARLRYQLHSEFRAGLISETDRHIADCIGWVLCGGDLPGAQVVNEKYLLRLEREAFIRAAHSEKSAERMRHVLATGKPIQN